MKHRLLIFYAVSLVFAFSIGAVSQHLPSTKSKAAKAVVQLCSQTNACKKSPLSIFSAKLLQQAQANTAAIPAGFCLKIPVLLYHHIQPQAEAVAKGQTSLTVDNGIFDQQMAYLASHGYTTISAEQLVNAVLAHAQVPGKPVVVTFDDGYLDNFVYAYPTMQKYHLTGNLMVPTGLLGNNSGTNSYFSWDQLKQMIDSGVFTAYDHTWSHFAMAAGPVDKDTYEATTAQQQLQQHLGHTSPIFVYPYGSGATVPWVWQVLKKSGFAAAFSTLPGVFQCESNIMALPRVHVGNASLASYGF